MILRFFSRQGTARPLMCLSLAFLGGILLGKTLGVFSGVFAVTALLCVLGFGLLRHFTGRRLFFLLVMAAFLLGTVRLQMATDAMRPVPTRYSVPITGCVTAEPEYREAEERLVVPLKLESVNGQTVGNQTVRLYVRGDELNEESLSYGDSLCFTGHLWMPKAASNPYQFDMRDWLLSNGFSGMGSADFDSITVTGKRQDLNTYRIAFRHVVAKRIDNLFPKHPDLVKAFVLGDRSELDEDLRDSFSRVGIAHLICISGMHISVLAAALGELLKRLFPLNTAVLLSILIILLYGYLIGYPVSLVRAVIMYAILALAPLFGRPSDGYTRLCAAMTAMLLVNPMLLYRSGFQLSFSASAGIMLLYEPLETLFNLKALKRKTKGGYLQDKVLNLPHYFGGVLCASLSAQIGTLPIVLASYGAQSLLTLPVNLIAVPLAMAAYPAALIALLLSVPFLKLGFAFSYLSDGLFHLLVLLVQRVAVLPVGMLRVPRFSLWLAALYYAWVMACSPLTRVSLQKRKFFPLGTAVPLALSVGLMMFSLQPVRALVFDNGSLNTSMITGAGKLILIDVGDCYSPALDTLSAMQRRPDALFCLNAEGLEGVESLLETLPPKVIYMPEERLSESEGLWQGVVEAADSAGVPVYALSDGDCIMVGKALSARVQKTAQNGQTMLLWTLNGNGMLFGAESAQDLPEAEVVCLRAKSSAEASEVARKPEFLLCGTGAARTPMAEALTGETTVRLDLEKVGAVTLRFGADGQTGFKTYRSVEVS